MDRCVSMGGLGEIFMDLQDRCRCQMCGCMIDIHSCILGTNKYGDLCDDCTEKILEEEDNND